MPGLNRPRFRHDGHLRVSSRACLINVRQLPNVLTTIVSRYRRELFSRRRIPVAGVYERIPTVIGFRQKKNRSDSSS